MSTVIDINALPLDNSIQLVPAAGTDPHYYAADNGVVRSEFYELGNRVVFKRNSRSFSWTPDSMRYVDSDGNEDNIYTVQDVPLETKANYARFNRSFPDIDDWFICHNDMLKHQILVQGFQRDPSPFLSGNIDFVFGGRIEFDADLRVQANGLVITGAFETGEGIDIIDTDGNVLFTLPQIVAYDSKIPDRAMTYGRYRVNSNDGDVLAFDIVVDNAWISSVERVYPIVIDPTVVVASAYDTHGNGGKKIVKLSNGWLIGAAADVANSTTYFYKSSDNGVTWTQLCWYVGCGYANPSGAGGTWALASNGNTKVYVLFREANTTYAFFWFDAATQTNVNMAGANRKQVDGTQTGTYDCSLAVSSGGVLTAAWISTNTTYAGSRNVRSAKSTDGGVTWTKQDGTAGVDQVTTFNSSGYDYSSPCVVYSSSGVPSITMQFAGAGPSYVIQSFKFTGAAYGLQGNPMSSTSYIQSNPSTITKLYGANIGRMWVVWDGLDATDTTKRNIRASWSDDDGATWGTAFKLTSGNTIDRQLPMLGENTNGDIYVFYQDNTGISYQICANGTTTFSGTTTFAASGTNPSAQERAANNAIGVVYMDASQVKFDKLLFNVAPNAPTLTTEPNFDATTAQTLLWAFSDPDIGNTQSAYQLIIIKVSDGSTALDTGKVVSAIASYSLGASALLNNNQYQWKVRTYDNSDVVGPYSSLSSFYTSAKPTTTITVPVTDGTVVTTSSLTANWTYSDPEGQASSAYQVKLTTSADVVLFDSGKVTATGVLALTIAYTLANSTSYKVKVTTWDAKDIASTEAVRTFTTSFTVPVTPTIALTAQSSYVALAIANPTPVGAQPAITSNDLYRRVTGTTAWTRIATGIANNGSYSDYATASGVSYDYYVQANGNNGTSASSATASKSITLRCVYLHDVTNPVGTIYRFKLDGKGRSASFTPDVTLQQFAGRTRPVAVYGESGQGKISVQLEMTRTGGDMEALRALMARNATIVYRDNRGRKLIGIITSLPEADTPQAGYSSTLDMIETAYTESV